MKLIKCANGIHLRADKILGIQWKLAVSGYAIQIILPDNVISQIGDFNTKDEAVQYADELAACVNRLNAEETS